MRTVSIAEAKKSLSALIDAIASRGEQEIVITRNGKPVARLVAVSEQPRERRLGLARDKYPPMSLEQLNATDGEIAKLFGVEDT